jgi:hypothetical protein
MGLAAGNLNVFRSTVWNVLQKKAVKSFSCVVLLQPNGKNLSVLLLSFRFAFAPQQEKGRENEWLHQKLTVISDIHVPRDLQRLLGVVRLKACLEDRVVFRLGTVRVQLVARGNDKVWRQGTRLVGERRCDGALEVAA